MFRSFTLFCFTTVFSLSFAFSQETPTVDKPEPIKATLEILSLFNESFQALTTVEPKIQASGLFQLLGFGINFDDKAPAKKIVETLLALAPSIEPVELRNQLYEGVAGALCDLEEPAEAVGVLNRITPPTDRYSSQLNLAIRLVHERENDKTLKPFDASELLRQAVAGTAEAKNVHLEAAARIFLGRELARQGKQTESVAAFMEAMSTARKIENTAQRNDILGLLFQSQIQYDQMDHARTTLLTVSDMELKRMCVDMLIQREKYADAERLLQTCPADEERDLLLQDFVVANIKTITEENINALTAMVSTDELRERFLQRVVVELQKNDRGDVAVQVGKRLKESSHSSLAVLFGKVEALVGKKQFAEAIQFVDQSEEDEAIRQHLKRQILMSQYRETHDESVAKQIVETYTGTEKLTMTQMNETAKQVAQSSNAVEQMELFVEILQDQFRLMDLAGARQTMKLISDQLDKDTDLARIIQHRLLLARLQAEMREKEKVKENLGKLMQMLSAVKDLKVLKDLVPQQSESTPAVTADGKIKLDLPGIAGEPAVDIPAIQNQLFQIYLLTGSLLARADAPAESKAAFEKAKELARLESVAAQKSEKLLIIAQFLVEEE